MKEKVIKSCKRVIAIIMIALAIMSLGAVESWAVSIDKYADEIDNLAADVSNSITAMNLDVENILQKPQLPNGCEIVSGCILLHHLGYDISKDALADNYLVKSSGWYGADPYVEYMGNPHGNGWYVWQQPVINALNKYLAEQNSEYEAVNVSDQGFKKLKEVIKSGRPCAVWVTVGYGWPRYNGQVWTTKYGNTIHAQINVHCMVIKGYDDVNGIVYLADPLGINRTVSEKTFEQVWNAMGQKAITYQIKEQTS